MDDSLLTTYIVTWTSNGINSIHSHTLIEQSSYTITGLTLDTVYTITVTATNGCGTGPEYRTSILLTTGMYHYHYLLYIILCSNRTITTMTAYSCGCCIHYKY